jgi:hypothetical protein
MQYRHVVFTALALAALLAFWSCKQPMEPQKEEPPYNEPDTANSYVRAIVNGKLWEVRSHDTVSVGGYAANGQFVAASPVITGPFSSLYRKDSVFIVVFKFTKPFNIQSEDFVDKAGKINILRNWESDYLNFSFIGSLSLVMPYNFDTLNYFTWTHFLVVERYLPYISRSGTTDWSIFSLIERTFQNIEYAAYILTDTTNIFSRSNAMVERASLTVDSYHEKPNRMSGHFNFRLKHPLTKEVIDIRDGYFDNMQFTKRGQ